MVPTSQAFADPQTPANVSQAEQRLAALGHDAEVVNQQLLGAQVDLDAKRAQQVDAQKRLADANAATRDAQTKQEQVRGTVDTLTAASYQGVRLDGLSALMISQSPQEMLDQMSGLDVLATDTAQRVSRFSAAAAEAHKAETDARNATVAARTASDAAAALEADLAHEQDELATKSAAVRAQLDSLTQAERANFAGTTTPPGYVAPVPMASPVPAAPTTSTAVPRTATAAPSSAATTTESAPARVAPAAMPAPVPGSSHGAAALQAALSKLGSSYVYGATGPNAFDCSGLVQWAFNQAGVSLPRTSQAQGSGGTPVSRDQLQPGDVVTFYASQSHVGIYAGGGNIVHASTEGQPVTVAPMEYMPFNSARRY